MMSFKNYLKKVIYKNQKIRKLRQFLNFTPYILSNKPHLVVFIIPFGDMLNGGVLSINNFYQSSKKKLNNSIVVLVTPKNAENFINFTKFNNDSFIFNCKLIILLLRFKKIKEVIFHVPEYYLKQFMDNDFKDNRHVFSKKKLIVNVLNQKNDEMYSPQIFKEYKEKYGDIFTITCAHKQYANKKNKDEYNIPCHHLSVYLDESNYPKKTFDQKENIILLSPDHHKNKKEIINILKDKLPFFTFITINKITFEDYKELVSKSKFQITFGEGLDGYFIEPYFCKSIGFSVYNEEFFTSNYQLLKTVYPSYKELKRNIVNDILELNNNKTKYESTWEKGFNVCVKDYNAKNFEKNVADYYSKKYNI